MEVFRSIDCSGCNKVIAFQHKVNDKIYGAPYTHGPECFSNAFRAATAGAVDFNRIPQMQRATPVTLKTDGSELSMQQSSVPSSSVAANDMTTTAKQPVESVYQSQCIKVSPSTSASTHSERGTVVEKVAQQPAVTKPTDDTVTVTEKVVQKPVASKRDVDTVVAVEKIVQEPAARTPMVDIVDSGTSSGPVKVKPSQSTQEVQPIVVEKPIPVAAVVKKAEAITDDAAKASSSKSTQRYLWSDCIYSPSLLKANAAVTTRFPWGAHCVMVVAKEDEMVLQTFQKQILRDYVSRAKAMTAPPEVGDVVIAPYDGEYFRGRINKVKRDKCEVKFVDCGDRVRCKFNEIFPVDETIMEFPIFGLSISTGIDSKIKLETASEKALYPKDGFIMNLTCKVEEAVPSKEPIQASLCMVGESTTLTERLTQSFDVNKGATAASAQITPAKKIKSVAAAVPEQRPFTWKKCKYSNSFVQFAPVHVGYQWSPVVYHINASNDQDEMQRHHNSLGKYARKWKAESKTSSARPEVDDIVIAEYETDYFRGRVEKVEGTECTVSFVDYGDSLKCQVTDIIPIDESIMMTPIYGMKVRLSQTPDCSDMRLIETLEDDIFQQLVLELPEWNGSDLKPGSLPIEVNLWDSSQQKTINSLVRNAITSSKK